MKEENNLVQSQTKYILSTSGRIASLARYNTLLRYVLNMDVVYKSTDESFLENGKVDPEKFTSALRGMPCIGGAISKDIKHSVMPFLDEIEQNAKRIGSVNTIVVCDGKLNGFNTDAMGFEHAILKGVSDSGIEVKSAVCYGYGGVASVVTTILSNLGIRVYITGRNNNVIKSRAAELSVHEWAGEQCDLFVNATPASESALDVATNFLPAIRGCKIVFDHEMPGKYLKEYCTMNGVYHIAGTEMYYPQMYAQWTLFLKEWVPGIEGDIPHLIRQAEEIAAVQDKVA